MTAPAPSAPRSEARKLYDILQGLHFLHRLKVGQLEKLLAVLRKRSVPAGGVIYRKGDSADALYLVSSGRVTLRQARLFGGRVLSSPGEGQYFGDHSLLSDSQHVCDAVADEPTELYLLHKEDFSRILMQNADIAAAIRAHFGQVHGLFSA
jgi:CRP/FNR family cyclic AMP-dependent transcriptional regulator